MYKQLTKVSLIASFGKNTSKPVRKTLTTLLVGIFGLFASGQAIAKSVHHLALAKDLPSSVTFAVSAIFVFIVVGFFILPFSYFTDTKSVTTKILNVLPLNKLARWYYIILPVALVCLLISGFFEPILKSLSQGMSANLLIVFGGYLLGLLAAVGLAITNIIRSITLKYGTFIALTAMLLYLFDFFIKSTNHTLSEVSYVVILLTLILCGLGIGQRYLSNNLVQSRSRYFLTSMRIPSTIFKESWFSIKMLRNIRTLGSFIFCLVLSSTISIFGYFKNQALFNPNNLILFNSLLACALACDLRGISRRVKTPEILAIDGVKFFVDSELKGIVLLNLFISLPIFSLISLKHYLSVSELLFGLASFVAASMLGLMFSTFFVPENGELGSQFFTAMLSISSLMLLPKLLKFSDLNQIRQAVCWLFVALTCSLVCLLTEVNRRKYYGNT